MKRYLIILLILILLLSVIPLPAFAYSTHNGLFVSSEYSDAYHVLFCNDVSKIGNHRTYYQTYEEAEADGKRPCNHCGIYIRIIRGDQIGSEKERQIVDIYLEGYFAGENVGTVTGYDQGFNNSERLLESRMESAYEKGYAIGKDEIYASIDDILESERITTRRMDLMIFLFLILPLFLIFSLSTYFVGTRKKQQVYETAIQSYKLELENCKRNIIQLSNQQINNSVSHLQHIRLIPPSSEFSKIERCPTVREICYNGTTLYIKTPTGKYYIYYRVPYDVYQDFLESNSKAQYYATKIANCYPFSQYE